MYKSTSFVLGNEPAQEGQYVEQIELSGLFALHCGALILRGETTPDPAYGWRALREAAERNLAAGRLEHLVLENPSAEIEALLCANHFDRCTVIEGRDL